MKGDLMKRKILREDDIVYVFRRGSQRREQSHEIGRVSIKMEVHRNNFSQREVNLWNNPFQ